MKLYYYEYETTVFRDFFDTEYDLFQGFLISSPLGYIQYTEEDEFNHFHYYEEFIQFIGRLQPRNFAIVELK